MKLLLLLSLLLVGCVHSVPLETHQEPTISVSSPSTCLAGCQEKVVLLDEAQLNQGFTCPANTKMVFPSFYQAGKVLVSCQCLTRY